MLEGAELRGRVQTRSGSWVQFTLDLSKWVGNKEGRLVWEEQRWVLAASIAYSAQTCLLICFFPCCLPGTMSKYGAVSFAQAGKEPSCNSSYYVALHGFLSRLRQSKPQQMGFSLPLQAPRAASPTHRCSCQLDGAAGAGRWCQECWPPCCLQSHAR